MNLGDTLSPTLVAARLITNAGSLARLANMPTSRVLSLGASKALFRKSGAVAANATGLFGQFTRGATSSGTVADTTTDSSTNTAPLNIHQLKCVSASRIQADTIRRKAARLLAAKSSLASRADCFRYHNPPDSDTPGLQWTEDQRLTAGTFGKELGQDVRQQLRVWAETNGIHADRSEEQIKAQRDRRKRYRKTKRKAWLLRKLSRSTTVAIVDRTTGSVAAKFETGFPEQINAKQALNHTATVASASSSSSESDHEFLSTRLKETEFMLVDDDSRYADDHLAKRRKVDLSRSGKSEILSPGICGTMSAKAPARRSPHIKTKQPIGVIG
ncbi:putative nucleolar protein NOP56 [Fasciola hepatica]|uniref:Nucleolar protein NOP56 n=1 Tax=Fasciola hepatica TaxID=6192 RepID=A0A4E0R8B4_FASHE|nr:putative nucleolar protein NOP56 [Fasciola hepatica]